MVSLALIYLFLMPTSYRLTVHIQPASNNDLEEINALSKFIGVQDYSADYVFSLFLKNLDSWKVKEKVFKEYIYNKSYTNHLNHLKISADVRFCAGETRVLSF